MKRAIYDSANSNRVLAVVEYGSTVDPSAWAGVDSVEITNSVHAPEIEQKTPNCTITIVSGDVTAVADFTDQTDAREALKLRVSVEYDAWIDAGVSVTGLSWTTDTLVIMPRDVELLTGVLAISDSKLIRGIITETAVALNKYKFGDGTIQENVIHKDLEELNDAYLVKRSTRFIAHLNVKGSIDAGVMPAQADYEECGLVLADFNGLGLS